MRKPEKWAWLALGCLPFSVFAVELTKYFPAVDERSFYFPVKDAYYLAHTGIPKRRDHEGGYAIAVDEKERVFVAGQDDGPHGWTFNIWCIDTKTRKVDLRFGNDGMFAFVPEGLVVLKSNANSIVIDDKGRVVVSGMLVIGDPKHPGKPKFSTFVVVRLTKEGQLDTSFNDQGYFMHEGSDQTGHHAHEVTLDAKGRILIAGLLAESEFNQRVNNPVMTRNDAAVWRLDANGRPDHSFGQGGVAVIAPTGANPFSNAETLVVDKRGRIVVAGHVIRQRDEKFVLQDQHMAVWRLDPDGKLDRSFGRDGLLTHQPVEADEFAYRLTTVEDIALDKRQRIIAAGHHLRGPSGPTGTIKNPVVQSLMVWRIGDDGRLDSSFGQAGVVRHNPPLKPGLTEQDTADRTARGKALVIDTKGRILIAGDSSFFGQKGNAYFPPAITLWRLADTGRLDNTFNGRGYLEHDFLPRLDDNGIRSILVSGLALDGKKRLYVGGSAWSWVRGAVDHYDMLLYSKEL